MSNDEMIEKTDAAIAELVHKKVELQKAYNYYEGRRDAELYHYLEENFGIGNPTSVEFTPFVKKHIDALVGEYLGTPLIPKVTCKDSETISNINRDKLLYITQEVYKFLQGKLRNSIVSMIDNKQLNDGNIEELLNKLVEDLDEDFTSEYEIAALNVVDYLMQDRKTDMKKNSRNALLDLLIAGYNAYQCYPSSNNTNVRIEVLSPKDVFFDINPESEYIKDSPRAVVRRWMNKLTILNKYGKWISKEDRKSLEEKWKEHYRDGGTYYVAAHVGDHIPPSDGQGLDWGKEIEYGSPDYQDNFRYGASEIIPVYEVQWTETDKDFVMHRYTTIRIADDIYIIKDEDDGVVRSLDNPDYCSLSVNGIYFTNRTGRPFSLMLACANLLDKYDLLNFIKDSVLANSGSIGDYVDMSMLPTWLGTEPVERLRKYIAYKKIGIAPIDTAQAERVMAGVGQSNTWMNGYDDTPKVQAILAILLAIESLELTLSSITGVFKERLQGIEQRDAVTNVKQSVTNSFIITKQYYQQMDLFMEELLLDALNIAKVVYKNGLQGSIILGEKYLRIFTALPEHFTLSDYDVHIISSTDIALEIEQIKQLIPELVKMLAVPPEVIFEALNCKSLSNLRKIARKAIKKQKEENNQLQLMSQQLQLMLQQLQETLQLLEQANKKVEQLNEQKIKVEQQKAESDFKVNWYKAQTEREFRKRDMDNDEKRVEIELLQLKDGNPYNDKVRQS